MAEQSGERLDLSKPRYDQSVYWGRAKHFFSSTDPRTILASTAQLMDAKALVDAYKQGKEPAGTTHDQVWAAKKLVDSAFHPETGELMFLPGRMSFQVPGNMLIGGCMMTFYQHPAAVVFWQVVNQTFNAVVNYTNRSASGANDASHLSPSDADWEQNKQLGSAFAAAVISSSGVAYGLNKLIERSPKLKAGMIGRFVPLVAVAAANCVNIPLMRQLELKNGINVSTESGEVAGRSKTAAQRAVAEVTISRIFMAAPGMIGIPTAMHYIEQSSLLTRLPGLSAPIAVLLNGLVLTFSTPMCCALFPQNRAIALDAVEPEIKKKIEETFTSVKTPTELFYNKGL